MAGMKVGPWNQGGLNDGDDWLPLQSGNRTGLKRES